MNAIEDLHLEKEILPLFDYTLHMFSKNAVLRILNAPLASQQDILSQQDIYRGFSANHSVLEGYSYTVSYLLEVHYFLNDAKISDFSNQKLRYKFLKSRKEKALFQSKLVQVVLLFDRLQSRYFSRLDLNAFPEFYRKKITEITVFLSHFNLGHLAARVREYKIKDHDILTLASTILDLKSKGAVKTFWEGLFLFEAHLSIHTGMQKNGFTFPTFSEKGIDLADFYHPLLQDPVTNVFRTKRNVVLVNGPNMSGKSTFLKAVGLCMYLAHLGIGIPAKHGEIPFLTHFSIAINRRDDLLNGYSHFMMEILNLKKVVSQASNGSNCLAIFDELFSGTNVEDAFEICKTTINGLCQFRNSIFFISTHIQKLQEIENPDVETYHIDCDLIDDVPTFTYKLRKGWSEIRVGRILFEKEGLNDMLN